MGVCLMMLRRGIAVFGSLCLLPILLLNGARAYADTGPDERDTSETAVVYRSSDFVVVDASSPTVSQRGEARFFPTDNIDPSTTVVIAEDDFQRISSRLAESDLSRDEVMRLVEETAFEESPSPARAVRGYVANYGVWSQGYWGDNVIGMNNSTTVYYGFDVNDASWMQACGQGRGYYRGYYGSEFGVWEYWYSLGCTSTTSYGSAGASFPWGNVASVKRFKAYSTGVIATGSWW